MTVQAVAGEDTRLIQPTESYLRRSSVRRQTRTSSKGPSELEETSDTDDIERFPSQFRAARSKSLKLGLQTTQNAFLSKVEIFKDCTKDFVNALIERIQNRVHATGSLILIEGEFGDSMYILNRGQVEILVADKVVATLTDGAVFGEMAMLCPAAGGKRTATVRAKDMCDCRVITHDVLKFTMNNFPKDKRTLMNEAQRRYMENKAKGLIMDKNHFRKPVEPVKRASHHDHKDGRAALPPLASREHMPQRPPSQDAWTNLRSHVRKRSVNLSGAGSAVIKSKESHENDPVDRLLKSPMPAPEDFFHKAPSPSESLEIREAFSDSDSDYARFVAKPKKDVTQALEQRRSDFFSPPPLSRAASPCEGDNLRVRSKTPRSSLNICLDSTDALETSTGTGLTVPTSQEDVPLSPRNSMTRNRLLSPETCLRVDTTKTSNEVNDSKRPHSRAIPATPSTVAPTTATSPRMSERSCSRQHECPDDTNLNVDDISTPRRSVSSQQWRGQFAKTMAEKQRSQSCAAKEDVVTSEAKQFSLTAILASVEIHRTPPAAEEVRGNTDLPDRHSSRSRTDHRGNTDLPDRHSSRSGNQDEVVEKLVPNRKQRRSTNPPLKTESLVSTNRRGSVPVTNKAGTTLFPCAPLEPPKFPGVSRFPFRRRTNHAGSAECHH